MTDIPQSSREGYVKVAETSSQSDSYRVIDSRSDRWEENHVDWAEQDLALKGGRHWRAYSIERHPLECSDKTTSTKAMTRYYSRLKFSSNPVDVQPPVQKVINSAQASSGSFTFKTGNEDLDKMVRADIDGKGSDPYTWLTSKGLERESANGLCYLMVTLPPADGVAFNLANVRNGSLTGPKWVILNAVDVLDTVEKEGSIINGQYSKVLMKATYSQRNQNTGFEDTIAAFVLYTEKEIIHYDSNMDVLKYEENTFGFVPILEADIGESLISEAVQYSKEAIELASLATQNMRDGYFNIIQALGFKLSETGSTALSADTLIQTNDPNHKIEFASPDTAPEAETRAKIEALKQDMQDSVQQAHTSLSKQSQVGSGVALKQVSSTQAQSVKYMMDVLLSKFEVSLHFAKRMTGLTGGDVIVDKPESYEFSTEQERLENAEVLQGLEGGAHSADTKKAINARMLQNIFPNDEIRVPLVEADNKAIDKKASAPVVPDFNE